MKLTYFTDANSANITLSNTFSNYHTYEIDWTPDEITWKIDGQPGRSKKRIETWNATDSQYHYPQTPARVQLSLWPGGLQSNAKGTVDWAGGYVDWNSQDIQKQGYYYAAFESVEITCFNADKAPGTNKGKSYTYNNVLGTNDTIVDGNKATILKSKYGTGTDMNKADPDAKNGNVATVPGQSGSGTGGDDHADDTPADDPSSTGSTPSITGSSSDPAATGDDIGNSFSQGDAGSATQSGKSGAAGRLAASETVLKGSLFAGVLAVVALMAL